MKKPFVTWQQRRIWPESFRWTLALISWDRGVYTRRSPHRHRKAGRA